MLTFSKLGEYGRLGNQLFQIAATIGISEKNNADFIFSEWNYSEYFENKLPAGKLDNAKIYKQRHFYYYDIFLDKASNWDLVGFYQSEKFFSNAEKLVRHYFTPAKHVIDYIEGKYANLLIGNTCSIHVRRGDYLKQSNAFPSQPIEYFNAAVELLGDNCKFLIFSDDIAWCKQNFKGDKYYFIENEIDIIDLFLMSCCQNHILSNSSFSWWGAWLNKSDTKLVICPERWFGPAASLNLKQYSKDIFSPEFKKLVIQQEKTFHTSPLYGFGIFIYYRILPSYNYVQFISKVVLRKLSSVFGK